MKRIWLLRKQMNLEENCVLTYTTTSKDTDRQTYEVIF